MTIGFALDWVAASAANAPLDLDCHCDQWRWSEPVPPQSLARIRKQLALHGFKWDFQVGDISTLTPVALILPQQVGQQLAQLAERLTAEAIAAEMELLRRPELLQRLGLPPKVRSALSQAMTSPGIPAPTSARVFRFDFHPTPEGWRISEANSDVPGGYTEASNFSRLMAEQLPGTQAMGNPAITLANALANQMRSGGTIALLSAPGYMEDQQVTAYLAELLHQRGCQAFLATPEQIYWQDGRAYLQSACYQGPLDSLMRFYQGEWLQRLPDRTQGAYFFHGSRTPICNPGSAVLIESKRFPLVWDELQVPLPTWKALLPETRDPRTVNWQGDRRWILKAAFGNTGEKVVMRQGHDRRQFWRSGLAACLRPQDWVAQQRFHTIPMSTPLGVMYPCVGVYTVNGKAAGIYGRMAPQPLIDFSALEMAVLIPN